MGERADLTCPRCGHYIPSDQSPGAFSGMPSRSDNQTEVCLACGRHEAILERNGRAASQSQWPVEVPQGIYEMYYADPM